jgi:8-oxo-dGTP pyrophosphatase MutT (NUDIX family)
MKSVILDDVARRDMTTRQVADELGIPVSTLQYWAAKGRITPAWRTPGGMARWDLEDLQRQLDIPGGRGITDPAAPLRPAIIAAIVTSKPGVLVERRHDGRPLWTFPAGEAEPGEAPIDTAIRETKEETGLEIRVSHAIGERDHPVTGRHMIYLAARPYHGTEVRNNDEAELAEVRWAALGELDDLMPEMFAPVRAHLERVLR